MVIKKKIATEGIQKKIIKKYKHFTKTMYTENQALKIICLTANDMEMMV